MAKGDEITTRFRVDISDLKKGIADANQQIKLANAEFKAATAGMDDWAKSADGIKAKLSQLESVLAAQKSKLEAYNEQLARQEKAYEENGRRAAELRAKLEELARNGVAKTSEEYTRYENALDACEREQESNQKAVDKLKITVLDQKAAVNKTEAEIGKYSTALDGLEGESKDADKASEDLSASVKEAGKSADDASGGFTVMKGALAELVADGIRNAISALKDFVKESIDVGKTFDASMSQVGAVSGATGEDLDALREKAKEMGANTKYSASEAADAFNYMAMAGWKTEDMLGGIEGVLSLAAASGEDLARTSDIVTDALTAFGLSAEDSGHFADVLAAASSNANTNVSMMGETFKYVAPLAGSLGYSAEDVASAVGLMANAGIKGSQAGTALRSALTRLVKPTKDAQGALAQLGLIAVAEDTGDFTYNLEALEKEITKVDKATEEYNEAVEKYGKDSEQAQKKAEKLAEAENLLFIAKEQQKQAALQYNAAILDEGGNMLQLSDTLGILREAFAGVDEAQKAQLAAQLFGQEAMSGMLAIINASEEDYNKLADAINNADGAAKQMAEVMQDNLEGDLTKFKSKLEGVQISLYEKFEPAMREGVEALSGLLDMVVAAIDAGTRFVEWLNSGSAGAAALKTTIAALVAAFVGFQVVQGVIAVINGAQVAFAALNVVMAANPIGLVVAAIAALVTAIAGIIKWFSDEEKAIKSVEQAQNDLTEAKKAAEEAEKSYTNAVDAAEAAQRKLLEAEEAAGVSGAELYEQVKAGALDYADMTEAQREVYKAYIAAEEAQRELKASTEALAEAKKAETIASYENDLALAKESDSYDEFKKSIIDAYEQGILSAEEARDLIGASMSEMSRSAQKTFMEDIPGDITEGLDPKKYETTGQKIKKWFGSVWEGIKNAFAGVGEWFSKTFEKARKGIESAWSSVKSWAGEKWSGIKSAFSDTKNWFSKTFSDAYSATKNAWSKSKEWAGDKWQGIKDGFANTKDWFSEKFGGAASAIKEKFAPITDWFSGIWDGIKNIFKPVSDWFGNVFDKIGNAIKAPLNAVIRAMNKVISGLNSLSIDIPDWVPFVGGETFGFNIKPIPELARGGVLKRGQMGLLEGSGAEAVVPLEKNKAWIHAVADDLLTQLRVKAVGGAAGNLSNSSEYNFTQIINAPKQPSRIELYRQTRNLLAYAKEAGGV